jgi:hypothetical protein
MDEPPSGQLSRYPTCFVSRDCRASARHTQDLFAETLKGIYVNDKPILRALPETAKAACVT